jgi:DNA-binding GntR family transcriptional regulator
MYQQAQGRRKQNKIGRGRVAMQPAMKKELPQPVRSNSLSGQVFHILKEAIFTGTFQPGEALREIHVARMLEVSQATVREALVQLEQVGLVVREKNRKTTVASFTREEVNDRLTLRLVLEELALVSAAPRLTAEDLSELSQLAASISQGIESGDYVQSALRDMRFHHFIWEKCGSPILLKTLDQLTTPMFAFLGRLHGAVPGSPHHTRPHEALVEALRLQNPEEIRKALRTHIEGSYAEFLR